MQTAIAPVHPTQTPEFKAWHAGSHVVNKHGEPLQVYHGTRTAFDTADTSDKGLSDDIANQLGDNIGMFFTSHRATANTFAQRGQKDGHKLSTREINEDQYPEGSAVVPSYLSLKNPKKFDGQPAWKQFLRDHYRAGTDPRAEMEKLGHDGAIIHGAGFTSPKERWYVAFHPHQVKSPFNRTFDPSDDRINFSREEIGPVEFGRRPAAGQGVIDFDAPAREYVRETTFHENKRPGEFAETKPKKDKPTTLRDEHGRVIHPTTGQVQARKGGETSEVDGQHYKAGHWMPVHGLTPKMESKPKAMATPGEASGGKADEDKEKARKYTEARVLSPEDLEAAKEKRESQQKWDEMNAGPMGKFKWLGESPNERALTDNRTSLTPWHEYAEKAGPAEIKRIIGEMEPLFHRRVDAAVDASNAKGNNLPSDTAAWEKSQPEEQAKYDMQTRPRLTGQHEKKIPGSHYARQLLQHLMHNENYPTGRSNLDNLHDLHRILMGTYESEFSRKPAAGQRGFDFDAEPGKQSTGHDVSGEPRDSDGKWTDEPEVVPKYQGRELTLTGKDTIARMKEFARDGWKPATKSPGGTQGELRTLDNMLVIRPHGTYADGAYRFSTAYKLSQSIGGSTIRGTEIPKVFNSIDDAADFAEARHRMLVDQGMTHRHDDGPMKVMYDRAKTKAMRGVPEPEKEGERLPDGRSIPDGKMACTKCGGYGKLNHFSHVAEGDCFKCSGTGLVKSPKNHEFSRESLGPIEFARHSLASTQFDIRGAAEKKMLAIGKSIPKSELAEDGIETDCHVTILYGLTADSPEELAKLVAGFGPVTIRFGKTSIFPANKGQEQRGGAQFDVLKIDIEGKDIKRLNKLVSKMDNKNTFPTYRAHATIGYLRPGEGLKHCGENALTGTELTFDSFEFSGKDGKKKTVSLIGKPTEFSRDWIYAPIDDGPVEFARRPYQPSNGQGSFGWSDDEQPTPVSSSNVHSFRYEPGGPGGGNLMVRYLSKDGGPGPEYRYFTGGPSLYNQMKADAAQGRSAGGFIWDKIRIRHSVSGHQMPYELAGTGPDKYIPRQAVVGIRGKNGAPSLTGEHFVPRRFQGGVSPLPQAPVRKSGATPIKGYDINKLKMPGEQSPSPAPVNTSTAPLSKPSPSAPVNQAPQSPGSQPPAPSQNPPPPAAPVKKTLIDRVKDLFKRFRKKPDEPKQFSREEWDAINAILGG